MINPANRLLLCVCIILSACGIHRENILEDAEYRLVGMSKAEVLACAGVPSRVTKSEGNEYLSYGGGRRNEPQNCDLTFIVREGRVTKLKFSGDLTGLHEKSEECYQLVRDCLR